MLRIAKITFLMLLCLCLVGAPRPIYNMTSGGGVAVGSGQLSVANVKLQDDFDPDTGANWADWGVGSPTCTVTDDQLLISTTGVCIDAGTIPDVGADKGEWAFWHVGTDGMNQAGAGLRVLTSGVPTDTDVSWSARCETGTILFRLCVEGATCFTVHAGAATCFHQTGDAGAFMVAGVGVDTEFCYWGWDDTPPGSVDPDTWGDALECASSDGTFALLDDYRGSGIADTWCQDTDAGCTGANPTNYSDTSMGVVYYSGNGNKGIDNWAHGDVQ